MMDLKLPHARFAASCVVISASVASTATSLPFVTSAIKA
jgi:hypothetical protein